MAAAALLAGCGQVALDLTPEGNPDRILTGSVDFREPFSLPPDAVLVVRVEDPNRVTDTPPTAVLGEPSPVPLQSKLPPKILGEQTVKNPGSPPIPFRVAYTAVDEQLRRGLIIEARISYGGMVRFLNVDSYAVTLGNASDSHTVWVNRIER
jgi:uncharacterized lipoprotein YbaY